MHISIQTQKPRYIAIRFSEAIPTPIFSSPEPKAHGWANSIPVTPSSVRQHFQTSSPLKPLGQLNSNFIWWLLDVGTKVCSNGHGHMTKMAARPIYGKNPLKSSSPEPKGRWPRDLVCSIWDVVPTKFVQMMILGWHWPTLSNLTSRSNAFTWEIFWKVDFFKTVEALVIILTWYV